jgi:hypothetical protein
MGDKWNDDIKSLLDILETIVFYAGSVKDVGQDIKPILDACDSILCYYIEGNRDRLLHGDFYIRERGDLDILLTAIEKAKKENKGKGDPEGGTYLYYILQAIQKVKNRIRIDEDPDCREDIPYI